MPNGVAGRIVLKEPSSDQKQKGLISVENLYAALNTALQAADLKVWVLLDRLDVAFVENHELEANALRALLRAYADLRNRDRIALKIFLREDIWKRITEGLREASHLTRFVKLEWTQSALLNLIMRRLLNNAAFVEEFGIDKDAVLKDFKEQERLFYRVFPKQVEQGPQKAPTYKWLLTRCADGSEKTAPRELIQLLNCLLEQETKRLEHGGAPAPDDQLFDRSVFKLALPTVSDSRLNQFLYAEYASLRPYVSKLENQKAEQTIESLGELWGLSKEETTAKAKELVEIGFFIEKGTRENPTYWVPFLYRDALHLVQGKAESDDQAGLKLDVS
ncbi:MAG: P-loop ATPase, Sll1717 family [Methylovirgula sp.]